MHFYEDVLHFCFNLPFLHRLSTANRPPSCRWAAWEGGSCTALPRGAATCRAGQVFPSHAAHPASAAGVQRPRPWPSSSSHSPSTLIIAGKRSSSGQPISPRDGALSIHPKLLLISKSQADPLLAHSHLAGSPARDPAWRNTGSGEIAVRRTTCS